MESHEVQGLSSSHFDELGRTPAPDSSRHTTHTGRQSALCGLGYGCGVAWRHLRPFIPFFLISFMQNIGIFEKLSSVERCGVMKNLDLRPCCSLSCRNSSSPASSVILYSRQMGCRCQLTAVFSRLSVGILNKGEDKGEGGRVWVAQDNQGQEEDHEEREEDLLKL
uniref:Uncharacterized protein n=1 Tax=Knipowitschia caucasica TaxID=637954 RepID=A0AAV2MKG0_KNICA